MLQQVTPKIAFAVSAAWTFVTSLHQEGVDRGMIATFGNDYRIDQDFTTSPSKIASTLAAVGKTVRNEGTRLYDSIQDVITTFWQAGRRDASWVLLIVTDGMDNRSKNYPAANSKTPELIGRYVGTRFNHERTNFPFLIGVGHNEKINAKALAAIGHYGQFPAVTVEEFAQLEGLFLQAAYQVTSELHNVYCPVGDGLMLHSQSEQLRLSRRPIDYAILIDHSQSMRDPATDGKLI